MRLMLLLLLTSCSSLSSSKFYGTMTGALVCGTLGAYLGQEYSPNLESDSFNKLSGAVSGSIICGAAGYYLGKNSYQNDPKNYEGQEIKFNSPKPAKQEA